MEKKKTKPSSSSSYPTQLQSQRPWLDLPDGVTELVLERLPLSDYVRFPAVCRQWRSIQRADRLRHSPGPPPMRLLPWLVMPTQEPSSQDSAVCYSPLEQWLYRFHLLIANWGCLWRCLASSRGWLLLKEDYAFGSELSLLNPVSGVRIQVPDLPCDVQIDFVCMSDDPDRILVMAADDVKILWRVGSPRWAPLPPLGTAANGHDSVLVSGKGYDLRAGQLMDGEPIPSTVTDLDCFRAASFGLNFVPSLDAFDPQGASVDATVYGSSSD